ncbi:hypothetical protein ANO14919_139560 [Xylariales sp. No.14919]|nr:hypothetical protein ANO14919_139560 [Xylariales sp. No.14919]
MALEVTGLVVGVVGLVPVCIQFNDYVRELVHDIKHSKTQKLFKHAEIESHLQIISLHKSAIAKLDQKQQDTLEFKITQLHDSLKELGEALEKFDNEPPKIIGSAIWAFRAKKKMQDLLDRISRERYGLTLQLILIGSFFRSPDEDRPSDTERILQFIAASLSRRETAQLTPSSELQQSPITADLLPIPGSDLKYKRSPSRLSFLIVEELAVVGVHDRDQTVSRVAEVSSVFHGSSYADRSFQTQIANISQCVGFAVLTRSVQLISEVPSECEALTSLHELLTLRKNHSLNARVGLAKSIAKAVFYTHAYKYVHKDLRPANILLEADGDASRGQDFGQVLLAGFGDARAEDGSSLRKGTSLDEVNVYQHPSRVDDVDKYTFLHDVYSLGVCLLELGLWTNFLGDKHTEIRKASPIDRQRKLNNLAEKHLPKEMGNIYAGVVKRCLGGIDYIFHEDGATGDEDVAIGSRYCETVLEELESICI